MNSEIPYEELLEEVEFLRFYMDKAYDAFGPADADVDYYIKREYKRLTGKDLPKGYEEE